MNGLNRRRFGSHLSGWHVMTNFRSSLIAVIYPPYYRESNNNTTLKNRKGAHPAPFPHHPLSS